MFKRLAMSLWLAAGVLGCADAPDFHLLDGREYRLADFRGRWLLVNYWAEWCEPCRRELPELAAFGQRHAGRVQVLAVNFDAPDNAELQAQVRRLAVTVPVVASTPAPMLPFPRPTGLPVTWVVDPSGQVHGPLLGPQTEASLLQALQKIDPAF